MDKDTTNLENSNPRVPPEILHSIVSWVVAYYLDSILAEDLPLDYVNGQLGTAPRSTFSNDSSRTDSDEFDVASTSSSEPFNPVLSLLQAGTQTRAPTLCVLSEALGIVVNWNGINFNTIDVDPWARIQDVRHFCNSYIISESAQPSLDAWDGQTEHSNVSEEDSRAARLEQIAPSPFLRAYVWLAATKYRLESTRRAVKAANSLGESSHRNFSHLIRQTHELPGITSDGNYPLRAIVLKRVKFRQWQVASFMVLDATLPAIARAMGHFRRLDESLEKEKSAETSVDQDRSPTMNEDYQEEYTRISTQLSATLHNLEKIVHCFGPTYLFSERSWEPIIESMANVSEHHPPTVIDSVAFKDCQDCALAITEAYLGYIHRTDANNVES